MLLCCNFSVYEGVDKSYAKLWEEEEEETEEDKYEEGNKMIEGQYREIRKKVSAK